MKTKILFILKLPFILPREVMALCLKKVYGCKVYVPQGKNRMGNKQYKLR